MSKKPLNIVKKSTSDEGKKNELYIPNSMNPPNLEVEMWGEGNNLVKNFHDLSADLNSNRAVITLSFDSGEGKFKSEDLDEVTYRVANPNPSSEAEWKKMENEALTDFLINKSSELLDKSNEEKEKHNDLKYTLKKDGDKINLLVEKTDGTDKKIIENLQLKGEFYLKEPVDWKDFVHINRPKIAWWKTTRGKITIGIVVGTILLLILIFHKKIWGWVKGDKKKTPETIIL